MKKIKLILFSSLLLVFAGCDKDFMEINTDPYALTDLDPALVFAGSQRDVSFGNSWESEATVMQYFVNAFNLPATAGFNFNYDVMAQQTSSWGQYTSIIRTYSTLLQKIETEEQYKDMINLKSMMRIWKAFAFMNIVDHHGDIPYFDAIKAPQGQEYYKPKYDDAQEIYNDLEKEIKEAVADLNPDGDFVSSDLFFGQNGSVPSNNAAVQVAQWKKLGNSILLRIGMRYSKLNPERAASIALEAFNGGVMMSNNDNVYVTYDGNLFTNGRHNLLIQAGTNPYYYYVAEPFVNQLKNTLDPRSKYIVAKFDNPISPLNSDFKSDFADQFGVPVGIPASDITNPALMISEGYRGPGAIGGLDYSQINVRVTASTLAPSYWITYAQTSLLLAEAAYRGWITGDAKEYYESAIQADMDRYEQIVKFTEASHTLPLVITEEERSAYLAHSEVAYDPAKALELINTQYWITNIWDPQEGWANFRRSGFPTLERNKFDDNLLLNGGDGYVHRYRYHDEEYRRNKDNVEAAAAKIGGNFLTSRVFWDPK